MRRLYFSDTPKGAAEVSAPFYTMVKTTKTYELNIYAYLKYLLENYPSYVHYCA